MSVSRAQFRRHAIVPACLLLLNAIEEVVVFKSDALFPNPYWRAGFLLVGFALGFTVVNSILAPLLIRLLEKIHTRSRRHAGIVGQALLFAGLVVGLYWLYYALYIKGPDTLLPARWAQQQQHQGKKT